MLSQVRFCLLVTVIMVQMCNQIVCAKKNSGTTEKIFEGDIELSRKEKKALTNEIKKHGAIGHPRKWKNGVIPYKISPNFTKEEIEIISRAMKEISKYTCIRFRPRRKEKDFVSFVIGKGCSSHVGKEGGSQDIKLNTTTCFKFGTVVHEMMHAIGFWHEQSRTDRDKFVEIKWRNILKANAHNFDKYTDPYTSDFGLPYDYGSLLHYSNTAFQKLTGLKTIVPKKNMFAPIGLREGMSHFDKMKINIMYSCKSYLE